jgi:hypothetical protein
MKLRKTAYLEKISIADWNRIFAEFPRQNLEQAIYDLTLGSGVLHGLEVQPQPVPNLTLRVTAGRGVWRDTPMARGHVMEALSTLTINLAGYVPAAGVNTVFVLAERIINTQVEAPITPPNAPVGHPAHDPGYTPVPFDPVQQDEIVLSVSSAKTGDKIILATIALEAGQTAITAANISTAQRESASWLATVEEFRAKLAVLAATTASHGTRLDALEGSGSVIVQPTSTTAQYRKVASIPSTDYAKLFVTIQGGPEWNASGLVDDLFAFSAVGAFAAQWHKKGQGNRANLAVQVFDNGLTHDVFIRTAASVASIARVSAYLISADFRGAVILGSPDDDIPTGTLVYSSTNATPTTDPAGDRIAFEALIDALELQLQNQINALDTRVDALELASRFVRAPGRFGPKSHQPGSFVVTEYRHGTYNGENSADPSTWVAMTTPGLDQNTAAGWRDNEKVIGAFGGPGAVSPADFNWPLLDQIPVNAKAMRLTVYLESWGSGTGEAVWLGPLSESLQVNNDNPNSYPTAQLPSSSVSGSGVVLANQPGMNNRKTSSGNTVDIAIDASEGVGFKFFTNQGSAVGDETRIRIVLEGWWL